MRAAEEATGGSFARLSRLVVDHPHTIILLVALVSAGLGIHLPRLRIDSSAGALLDPMDPDVVYYEDVKRAFGTEEIDIVVVEAEAVYMPATLEKIRDLTQRIADVPGVVEVTSLSTARNLAAAPDGAIDTAPLMEEVPRDAEGLRRLRQRVSEHPLLGNILVSADGQLAALLVKYDDMSDAALVASGIHDRIASILAAAAGPERIVMTGSPAFKVTAARLMRDDLLKFTPGTMLVIVLVLLLSFRSLRGVVLPIVTTGIGLLWTMGLMAAFDVPIDLGTLVLPTLLMVVGGTYATHVVSRYYEELESGGSATEIALRIVRHLGVPVIVTALTTVLGFASLAVYRVEAIRSLGIFAAAGITALFVLSLTFVPAVLVLLRVPAARTTTAAAETTWLTPFLEWLGRFGFRHSRLILVAWAVILAGFVWGMRWVRVDTNYPSYLPDHSALRQAGRLINERLGGSISLFVTVDAPEPGVLTRIDALRRLAVLQEFIDRIPGVGRTASVADYLKMANRAFNEGKVENFALPDSDAAVQQYLLLFDPETLRPFVNGDASRAAIVVRTSLVGSRDLGDAIRRIDHFARDAFPPEYGVHVTGTAVLFNRTADSLTSGQVQSFALALAIVFAILALMFLSVRFGVVAMVPNVVPIFVFFGLLGWADIPLSISTAIIASISIGIGVDEAVHFLAEFNHHLRRKPDQQAALLGALRSVGPPILYATSALSLGLLVPGLSNFAPVRYFGVLSAATIAVSLVTDLVLLPALLASARFVTLWDVLTVSLGRAPHETIPLFRGLRAAQARIAALMGTLRTVGTGEVLCRRGEPAREMWVVIRGAVEVLAPVGGRLRPVARAGLGDVVGEMGLLRRQPRAAEVRALEDTELLAVDDRFLRALRRRYPRIGTTVLFNLTQILSDRLQHTTDLLADVHGERAVAAPVGEAMR
jgi:hypothetical protein